MIYDADEDTYMLQETLSARVNFGTSEKIKSIVKQKSKVYNNFSHFVRCALEREFRRVKE